MKAHIIYDIVESSAGGGNQFLRGLRKCFEALDAYAHSPLDADVFLFNGHQKEERVRELRAAYPRGKFIHRLDGAQKLYNHPEDKRQDTALRMNIAFADATVYQSLWALDVLRRYRFPDKPYRVIHNGVDRDLFKMKTEVPQKGSTLIAVSWSANPNKGFALYQHLDRILSKSEFDVTFVGRSPVQFRNIRMKEPMSSRDLSQELRKHDVFITATRNDCCSNCILEAQACGLPVVALSSGGTPEIVGRGGKLFQNERDVMDAIRHVSGNLRAYFNELKPTSTMEVAVKYLEFFKRDQPLSARPIH